MINISLILRQKFRSLGGLSFETTEEPKPTETSQVLTVFNKTIHHEDDSSEDKSVIKLEPTVCITSKHDEDDSIEDQPTTEIETYTKNGEQDIAKEDQPLTTNFEVKVENRKVEGLITYSFNFDYIKTTVLVVPNIHYIYLIYIYIYIIYYIYIYITYSYNLYILYIEQQIFKFKVNSENNQEL